MIPTHQVVVHDLHDQTPPEVKLQGGNVTSRYNKVCEAKRKVSQNTLTYIGIMIHLVRQSRLKFNQQTF